MEETTLDSVLSIIKEHLNTISPGQRIQYVPPQKLFWDDELNELNWDMVEEIQMFVRGPLEKDIFVTLRFDPSKSSEYNLVIDIYRL